MTFCQFIYELDIFNSIFATKIETIRHFNYENTNNIIIFAVEMRKLTRYDTGTKIQKLFVIPRRSHL